MLLAFFYSGLALAQDPDLALSLPLPLHEESSEVKPFVKFETVSTENKDQITHQENRWGFAARAGDRPIKFYGASVDKIEGRAPWIQYSGYRTLGTLDWQPLKDWNLSFFAGATELTLHQFMNRSYGLSRTLPMWKVRSAFAPIVGTELRLEANNDFTYMGWLDRWDQRSQIMAVQNYFAEVESFTVTHWQFRTNARVSVFEDTNQQQAFDHQILRDVILSPFVLRIGAGGGWTRFQNQWAGYWNPAYFEYYGLRVVASKDLTQNLNLEGRFNYGYHREINRLRGVENSGEVLLRYQTKNSWAVNLKGSTLDSEQGGWWKNDVSVYFEMPL